MQLSHNHILTGDTKCGGVIMAKKKQSENEERIITDPFGSYTGHPVNADERPVQDADDL